MEERFKDWKKPVIEHNKLTQWNWMVAFPENLKMGEHVDIGAFCYLMAKYGITLGDSVELGSHTSIYSYNTIENKKGAVTIGDGTKIGTHSSIMQGVTIGKNCLIGAYSFVKSDIPDDSVAYGVPAKVVRKNG